jgi:Fe-S cluster assembly iron-binding protein IscA
MIHLTDSAASALLSAISTATSQAKALRIAVETCGRHRGAGKRSHRLR